MHTAGRFILAVILLSLSLVAACRPAPAAAPVAWPTDRWAATPPEAQGMDSSAIARMFERIEAEHLNLRSLLIARNGTLVTEAYFHPYTAETRVRIQSITKSVVGSLTGIAIAQGFIAGVDAPLLGFFPGRPIANVDTGKQAITLRHLLSMTSGLDCDDGRGTAQAMMQSKDWVQFMLDLPMAEAPGRTFHYCSGNAHLLVAVLAKATGRPVLDFANAELFRPLGIANVPPSAWATDPQGYPDGSSGLYLTPQDVARFGLLYLNRGAWAGKQIVPAAWVKASLTACTDKGDGTRYGYLWTVYPANNHVAALGMGGQQLHLFPGQNLLVMMTAGLNVNARRPVLESLLDEYILPAARPDVLPENAAGAQRIAAQVAELARPIRPVPPLPAVAGAISGKVYTLDTEQLGWDTVELVFEDGSDQAELHLSGVPPIAVGLDHLYRSTPLPGGSPVVVRGTWADDRTFVVEQLVVGELAEYQARLVFEGERLTLTLEDTILGTPATTAHGEVKP